MAKTYDIEKAKKFLVSLSVDRLKNMLGLMIGTPNGDPLQPAMIRLVREVLAEKEKGR